jgi:uncharacterized protein DUF1648
MAETLRSIADIGSWVTVVAMWIMAARAYPVLPDRIPIHFNWAGRPDGWGHKRMIWLLPVIGVFVYFTFFTASAAAAARAPAEQALLAALAWLRFETLAMFLFIESRTIAVARGRATGLGILFLPITLVIVLGTSLCVATLAPHKSHAAAFLPPPRAAIGQSL